MAGDIEWCAAQHAAIGKDIGEYLAENGNRMAVVFLEVALR